MKLTRVTSKKPKHEGAIFFKVADSKDDFVCKFYPGHENEAYLFEVMMDSMYVSMNLDKVKNRRPQ